MSKSYKKVSFRLNPSKIREKTILEGLERCSNNISDYIKEILYNHFKDTVVDVDSSCPPQQKAQHPINRGGSGNYQEMEKQVISCFMSSLGE